MSKTIQRTITCPKCGHKQEATLWSSVNVTRDSWAKAKVLDQSLFQFTCEECGNSAPLAYPCLYHDMENKLMIYLIPHFTEKDMQMLDGSAADQSRADGYTLRMVGTANELAEKVVIFQNGRDDRVIELCKLYIHQQLGRQRPDFIAQDIFYNKGKEELILLFNSQGKGLNAPLPQELYQITEASFASQLAAQEPEEQLVVDYSWAMDMLESVQPAQ